MKIFTTVSAIFFIVILFSCIPSKKKQGGQTAKKNYDVAAFYWPAYHPDERFRGINVFPDGKGEWEAVYKAAPKFDGHRQPNVPLWGYENEANPQVMEKKIKTASDYGVNVFIFDWYWYGGKPFLESCLNNGFLKASNNGQMKFYLMWANHDHTSYLDPSNPDKKKVYWEGEVDRPTFDGMIEHLINDYFKHPSYYKIDGEPVFSIYELSTFINGMGGIGPAKEALGHLRRKVIEAGFPGLHLQAILWKAIPESLPATPGDKNQTQNNTLEILGINSLTNYQWCHYVKIEPRSDYKEWGEIGVSRWAGFDSAFSVPFFPHVSIGWDSNPRFPEGIKNLVANNTPQQFKIFLQKAKEYADNHPGQPRLITINAWNEWAEGSYLEPDTLNKFQYLQAVREIFK